MNELTESNATFSEDREYRFALWRFWDERPKVMFVGLNPSTADEVKDDPTVRRCIGFARRWGYGGMYMCNLFAFRSTNPNGLLEAHYPVGWENNQVIKVIRRRVALAVACWGNHGQWMGRGKKVLSLIEPAHVLGLTLAGEPKHPLYMPLSSHLVPYTEGQAMTTLNFEPVWTDIDNVYIGCQLPLSDQAQAIYYYCMTFHKDSKLLSALGSLGENATIARAVRKAVE